MASDERSEPTDDDREWITINAPWGSYRLRRSSFLATVLDPQELERGRTERIERGTMDLSLGKFADLLWMTVPESRPLIVAQVRKEFDEALMYDHFLGPFRDTPLANALYVEILLPAMKNMPAQRDVVRRCLAVIRRVIAEATSDYDWDVMSIEILDPLESNGWGNLLAELDPELMALHKNIREAREQQ